MGSPKTPPPPPPPQPDAPAAKAIFGEDSLTSVSKKRTAQRQSLVATYLTSPTPGVGVQL